MYPEQNRGINFLQQKNEWNNKKLDEKKNIISTGVL